MENSTLSGDGRADARCRTFLMERSGIIANSTVLRAALQMPLNCTGYSTERKKFLIIPNEIFKNHVT
jgi:hypothetical protein